MFNKQGLNLRCYSYMMSVQEQTWEVVSVPQSECQRCIFKRRMDDVNVEQLLLPAAQNYRFKSRNLDIHKTIAERCVFASGCRPTGTTNVLGHKPDSSPCLVEARSSSLVS